MKKSLTVVAITVALLSSTSISYAYTSTKTNTTSSHSWAQSPWKTSNNSFLSTTKSTLKKVSTGTHASSTPVVIHVPAPATPVAVTVPVISAGSEVRMQAYLTGYSYWDNTPAASSEISNPVMHKKAGGTGTFADPVTLAVGHSILSGKDILDYAAGTKFYVPNLRKYFITEDTCGDGNNPQNGPCHSGYQGHVWLDLYVNGASATRSQSDSCMDAITDVHTVIQNPASNYAVVAGDLSANCKQYGETVVKA